MVVIQHSLEIMDLTLKVVMTGLPNSSGNLKRQKG
jgi:hypothetical protein